MEPIPTPLESGIKSEIRVCSEEDIAALNSAIPSPGYHENRFQGQRDGRSSYLIAWLNGVPVGHLNLMWGGDEQPDVQKYVRDCPELNAIGVWPAAMQSCGIGSQLISHAEDMVKKRCFKQVGMGVEVNNLRAKALYEKLGYKDWGHGIYHDKWVDKDIEGNEVRHNDPCLYLIKGL